MLGIGLNLGIGFIGLGITCLDDRMRILFFATLTLLCTVTTSLAMTTAPPHCITPTLLTPTTLPSPSLLAVLSSPPSPRYALLATTCYPSSPSPLLAVETTDGSALNTTSLSSLPCVASFHPVGASAGVISTTTTECVEEIKSIQAKSFVRTLPRTPIPLSAQRDAPTPSQAARVAAMGAAKNPKVDAILAEITTELLMSFVDSLSAIFSRLSPSPGAFDTSTLLASWYRQAGWDVTTQAYREDYAPNVVAELKGVTHPDKIVVAIAHFDDRASDIKSQTERAPGADDNGSGTAALLAMASALSGHAHGFAYTIRLVSVSGEEQGLLGSKAYVTSAVQAGDNIVMAANADMLGWCPSDGVDIVGFKDKEVTPWLVSLAKTLSSLYTGATTADSASCCSDYISFFNEGIPAVGFFESALTASAYPEYHSSQDLPDKLNGEHFQIASRSFAALVASFAEPL